MVRGTTSTHTLSPSTRHTHTHARTPTQGLTEEQALAGHPNLDIYTSSFRAMRNTLSGSPLRTFMKLVVDADSRVVLGAHMVGEHAAEIMQVRPGLQLLV